MSKTKFDNIIRSALWNSYNNICFYCNKPLEWDDLNIDHIVPEHLMENIQKFEKVIFEYDLNRDFNINALYNLVPSHSKCNFRKSGELFIKQTTLYYLGLTNKASNKVEKEIEKLKKRRNKGQIMSKLQSALATNLIDLKELQLLITSAEENNWENKKIKLPIGVEFVDEVYDLFYLNDDLAVFLDKKLLLGKVFDSLELVNDIDEKRVVSTLREWKEAEKNNFYPLTTFAIKMSAHFTFLDELLTALSKAKMPKLSFISEPWIELDNLDFFSPNIIHDFEGKLKEYTDKGLSIGDLVRLGIVRKNPSDIYKISLEFNGIETSYIEQFRADFNNDGIEEVFVRGWTQATGGTLGYGFTSIFSKTSKKQLIDEINSCIHNI